MNTCGVDGDDVDAGGGDDADEVSDDEDDGKHDANDAHNDDGNVFLREIMLILSSVLENPQQANNKSEDNDSNVFILE